LIHLIMTIGSSILKFRKIINNGFKESLLRAYYRDEIIYVNKEISKLDKQPEHLILSIGSRYTNMKRNEQIIKILKYASLSKTTIITCYDAFNGINEDHEEFFKILIIELQKSNIKRNFIIVYYDGKDTKSTIPKYVLIAPDNIYQVQHCDLDTLVKSQKNSYSSIIINLVSYSDTYWDFFNQLKTNSSSKYHDIRENLHIYNPFKLLSAMNTPMTNKSFETSMIISFSHNSRSTLGIPFDFLINGEILLAHDLAHFGPLTFLECYQRFAYSEQRCAK